MNDVRRSLLLILAFSTVTLFVGCENDDNNASTDDGDAQDQVLVNSNNHDDDDEEVNVNDDDQEGNNISSEVPDLYLPLEGAVMDNGRTDKSDLLIWDFSWSEVQNATNYHLYVMGPYATTPVIDDTTPATNYNSTSFSYIVETNRLGWMWKVRAQIDGQWKGWTQERTFDVEPVDTD